MADNPRVIILGKGKASKDAEMQGLIESIELDQIPGDLIDSMYVTVTDPEEVKYKIDSKFLTGGIDYNQIDKYLGKFGMINKVSLIEIVVDFDRAKTLLDSTVSKILEPYFDEPETDQ